MSRIPKVIHMCWFSGDPYPELIQRCINSWKRVLPDYKIKIWDYEMAAATKIPFVIEALQEKKWAFAADVIRLYSLYKEGGVYMDSDVYVKRDFTELLVEDFVSFIEYHPNMYNSKQVDNKGNRKDGVNYVRGMELQAAFLAAVAGHPFLDELLEYYRKISFHSFYIEDSEGKYINTEFIAPRVYMKIAETKGVKYKDETQILKGMKIYESKYFAFGHPGDTSESYALHCCDHSWSRKTRFDSFKSEVKNILGAIKVIKFVKPLDYIRYLDSLKEMSNVNKYLGG